MCYLSGQGWPEPVAAHGLRRGGGVSTPSMRHARDANLGVTSIYSPRIDRSEIGSDQLARGSEYEQHAFPKFENFPNGNAPVQGKVFFGIFGANGWTGMLIVIAGGLLMFGAAQHLLAKTMSLIVGMALTAAAIIALASGNVLGLAAANRWTELAWGVVAAILLFNTVIPRRRRTVATDHADGVERRQRDAVAPAAGSDAAATEQGPVANGHGYRDARLGRGDPVDRIGERGRFGAKPDQPIGGVRPGPRAIDRPGRCGLRGLYGPPRPRAVGGRPTASRPLIRTAAGI